MNAYIKSDLYRYTSRTDFRSFLKQYLRNSSFRYQVAFRLLNSDGIGKALGFSLWYMRDRSICIPKETKIGYGLYIGHGSVVINRTAIIGNNVNLSNYTTIGSNHNKAATIGDNVYIGPNCVVVENVNIGDNVTIGAGSVVTKDIPAGATAVGNYAKVINFENPGRYIKNRWEINKKEY